VCYSLLFIALVNLVLLARLGAADDADLRWRLLAVAAVPPLERLLTLCMPPLRWEGVQASVLWGVPIFIGVLVLLASPLLAGLDDTRARLMPAGPGSTITALTGQACVALVGAGLGAGAGLLAAAHFQPVGELLRLSEPEWFAIVLFVFVGCVQELLYRGVIQPVATAAAGLPGAFGTCALMAYVWLAWVGGVVAAPVIATTLVFGWVVYRTRCLVGVIVGRGLFSFTLALLWQQVLR
jgi:hypothetical protein